MVERSSDSASSAYEFADEVARIIDAMPPLTPSQASRIALAFKDVRWPTRKDSERVVPDADPEVGGPARVSRLQGDIEDQV